MTNLPELAARCESIGRNCEFGLVQRSFGIEPLGLLRWAASPLASLTRAFQRQFVGLGQDMSLEVDVMTEWQATDRHTGLLFHTHCLSDRAEDDVRKQEARRLPWLANKLTEGIRANEKTLVHSNAEMSDPFQALALVSAIRAIGPAPILLVCQGSGPTFTLGDNVFVGFIETLTTMNQAFMVNLPEWTRILTDLDGLLDHAS